MKNRKPLTKTQRAAARDRQRQATIRQARRILARADQSFVGDAARHGALVDLVDELKECLGIPLV